jgi:hypothetical protein
MGFSLAACWAAPAGLRERGKRGRKLGCAQAGKGGGFLHSFFLKKICFQNLFTDLKLI